MRTELYKITTGSLLHDVGKVVHRTGDSHSHAESGYAFLKDADRAGRRRNFGSR